MHERGTIGWVVLALAGLAVAVALSVAASNLSSQPIGLSAEPLRAGDRLAPESVRRTKKTVAPKKNQSSTQTTQTATIPTTTTPTTTSGSGHSEPGDDYAGRDSDHDDD